MDEKQTGIEEDIYLAPESANAEPITGSGDAASKPDVQDEAPALAEEPETAVFAVGEIRQMRGENCKVFHMSDGTEQAVYYPESIHVFNEETASYDEIDNTLEEEEDGRHFRNRRNGFVARFSREETNSELFSVEKGMHRVTVSAKRPKSQMHVGVVPRLRKSAENRAAAPARSTLMFDNVMAGTDMEYTVMGDGVKENIVVREKAAVYRYPFIINCENVAAEYRENDKRVVFSSLETGEEVFCIPAPYMSDAAGVVSTGVFYEMKPLADGTISFTVTADSEWMNAEDRAFPVTIDPQITVSGTSQMSTYSWKDGQMILYGYHYVTSSKNSDGSCSTSRMYINLGMPTLPRNPRIKKVELELTQFLADNKSDTYPNLGLYKVTNGIQKGDCTPYHNALPIDYLKMKKGINETYTFDITSIYDSMNKGETSYPNLVLKMMDEEAVSQYGDTVVIRGCNDSAYPPKLTITYESSYGVNTSYRTHSHELGRFGTGSVDLQCGNLMLESEDFAWGGNRMPVTIKHLYTSALLNTHYSYNNPIKLNTANFSAMDVGQGWKLNVMQSMVSTTFQHEGTLYSGYVFIGENGDEAYFKKSDKQICENNNCYNLFVNVTDEEMLYDPYKRTIKKGTETLLFDTSGRLIRVTDEFGNHMDITFTAGRITSVTDGAGRDFSFAYTSDGRLTSITAPDGSSVCYTYIYSNFLSTVTYPDGRKAEITYTANKPAAVVLKDAGNTALYKVAYSYSGSRVYRVSEYGVENGAFVAGPNSTYSFSAAARRTIVQTTEPKDADEGETANNVIKTVYTFDDDGQIISEYAYSQDTGNVGVEGGTSGINPYAGDTGIVCSFNNLLLNSNFDGSSNWTKTTTDTSKLGSSYYDNMDMDTQYGKSAYYVYFRDSKAKAAGIYQTTSTLPAGEYTFSVYMMPCTYSSSGSAYIRVTKTDGTILAESERLTRSASTRLVAPFELKTSMSVRVGIYMDGDGYMSLNAAQLESNAYANDYNMLNNGAFEHGLTGWTSSSKGVSISTATKFNLSRSLCISGDLADKRFVSQDIAAKYNASIRETFTLSGWAKGYGIVDRERNGCNKPQFQLRAVIQYANTSRAEGDPVAPEDIEEYTAVFSPCTEEWQFATVQFTKQKYRPVKKLTVYCDYNYNCGTAYFDDIQLTRDSVELWASESDFTAQEDEETKTEETSNTPPKTEDNQEDLPTFEELKDAFGNSLTETTFTDGEFGTIYRAFGYTSECNGKENAGNDLIRETDACGHNTLYTVDEETSRNEEVTDRCGNKTAYEYDAAGRVAKVTSKRPNGSVMAHVSYAYDAFDNLTEITRGDGMKYALVYNAYHNLESIGVAGKTNKLVSYTYKNGNGRLKAVKYANGHIMRASYNTIGQMVAEKWCDAANCLIAHYKYVYDGKGNIVRSLDMRQKREYSYTYEDNKIVRSAEYGITVNGSEVVTSRTLVNSILYSYDKDGKLTSKRFVPASGAKQEYFYENPEDGNPIVTFKVGDKTITSHSKTDAFGRKVFDELQLGSGFVSRQFSYHAGKKTDEHVRNDKLKSSPTTQLVSQIVLSDGRTLSYEYDAEERITKVTDSVDGVTQYTYDALGQLLTETVNGTLVGSMTYDNYGNILTKGSNTYTYGDSVWKDRLTSFNGQSIAYDAQGNPTNYRGKTLTWEKGRQLKSYGSYSYTYNANGFRTSKTVSGVKHTYTLDGMKILKETWGSTSLTPLYDNEDEVCGILYNSTPYYFLKNLQGDVIAITNKSGEVVARYTYDAWGKVLKVTNASGTVITSSTNVANVNPFRYRGYYYDTETSLYYLQSRYYDPDAARFINADDAEVFSKYSDTKLINLFTYCENDPVNGKDVTGAFFIKKLAEIFLSAVFGIVFQLFIDFAIYLVKKLVYKKNVSFKAYPGDYIEQALSWAIDTLNPFSRKKQIIGRFVLEVLGSVLNQITNLIAGRGFDLQQVLKGAAVAAVKAAIKKCLGKKTAKEISKLKKHHFKNRKALKNKKMRIKAKYKILGQKINLAIDIPAGVVDFVAKVLT